MWKLGKTYILDVNNKIAKQIDKKGKVILFQESIGVGEREYGFDRSRINVIELDILFSPFIILDENKNHKTNIKILIPKTNTVGWINSWVTDYFIEIKNENQ